MEGFENWFGKLECTSKAFAGVALGCMPPAVVRAFRSGSAVIFEMGYDLDALQMGKWQQDFGAYLNEPSPEDLAELNRLQPKLVKS